MTNPFMGTRRSVRLVGHPDRAGSGVLWKLVLVSSPSRQLDHHASHPRTVIAHYRHAARSQDRKGSAMSTAFWTSIGWEKLAYFPFPRVNL